MALFLNRDLSFIDGIYRKGHEVHPVREESELHRLKEMFSSIYVFRLRKDYLPGKMSGSEKVRWIRRSDVS